MCSAKLHNIERSQIAIGKMVTNQSFTEHEAVVNGETVQIYCSISQPRFYQKIHPSRDAAFGIDCLTPFRILKIIIESLKNGFW